MSECVSPAEEQENKNKCGDLDSGNATVISNELLLVGEYSGVEKMDELTSLEREIAELHHVEPTQNLEYQNKDVSGVGESQEFNSDKIPSVKSKQIGSLDGINFEDDVSLLKCNPVNEDNIPENIGSTALEHEDLIAVLKGIDDHSNVVLKEIKDDDNEEQCGRSPSVAESELVEGVTIEGEGQFQIMEVVYDELDEQESIQKELEAQESIEKPSPNSGSTSGGAISHLTSEEIRAMAMEQIAGLNARGNDRQRKRKQEIKPLQVEDNSDLVTSLGADWSDDDTDSDMKASTNLTNVPKNSELKHKKRIIESEAKSHGSERKEQSSNPTEPIQSDSVMVKIDSLNLETSNEAKSNISDEANKTTASLLKPVVGFKRTRVVKPKVIWDPDAPETQISYAQLARNSSKINIRVDNQSINTSSTSKKTSLTPTLKGIRVEVSKNQQPDLKEKKSPNGSSSRQIEAENKLQVRTTDLKTGLSTSGSKVKQFTSLSATSTQSNKNKKDEEENTLKTHLPVKRRSQTPVINGGGSGSKKKRGSEIDRLVSDEGAANMLHSLESERSKLIAEQGTDKPHKPLMRSRAATISERILKPETTPTTPGKVSSVASGSGGLKNKRTNKQKPSSTWDYVYKQKATEDAMIIRRRSNSSYSSNASLRRLSLDAPVTKATNGSKSLLTKNAQQNTTPTTTVKLITSNAVTKTTQRSLLKSSNGNNTAVKGAANTGNAFEFAKPESKSHQKGHRRIKGGFQSEGLATNEAKKSMGAPGARKGSRSPANVEEKDKTKSPTGGSKASIKQLKDESVVAVTMSDVVVKKVAKVAQIAFNTQKAKINYTFTTQMLNKLVDILENLSKDAECNAVVITTNAPNFCYGIDFTDLTTGTLEKRKHSAVQLAAAVKNYLKTLALFPKPLIAGVNGNNIGLGVMQLPLFDIVIGSDKGTYETPYAKIGQVPEGFCIWNNITKIRDNYKTKLFWLGEKLHSTESALSGLVHKLTASGKVNDDALLTAKKLAATSTESYRFMKKSIVSNYTKTINTALDEEFDVIIEQWTSAECYESFKKYLDCGHF
ncbi:uncharacterized protein LOC101450057 [Ceratitis capitata]|uniref:uncharacterized protein LOC101450057 n=1 Tax=Ceratitis capitata TaxID=7213 RepID=UPI00032A1848|nr:uncharacterized protein LOC101450057 [Ceratitis capitata]